MPFEGGERGAALTVPQAQGFIRRPRQDAPIGELNRAKDRTGMPFEGGEWGTALPVPEAQGFVPRPRQDTPVGQFQGAVDAASMPLQHPQTGIWHRPRHPLRIAQPHPIAMPLGQPGLRRQGHRTVVRMFDGQLQQDLMGRPTCVPTTQDMLPLAEEGLPEPEYLPLGSLRQAGQQGLIIGHQAADDTARQFSREGLQEDKVS